MVDASDPAHRAQTEVTLAVLAELGADRSPRWTVLNKADRLDAEARERLARERPDALLLSAKDPRDVAALRARIVAFFQRDRVEAEIFVPWAQQRLVGEAHACAEVLAQAHDERGTTLRLRATPEALARLRGELGRR